MDIIRKFGMIISRARKLLLPKIRRKCELFIPGVIAAGCAGGGGGGGYVAKAVGFDGLTALFRSTALTGISNHPIGVSSYWFKAKLADLTGHGAFWTQATALANGLPDCAGAALNEAQIYTDVLVPEIFVADQLDNNDADYQPSTGSLLDDAWHHALFSWNTNAAIGMRRLQVAIDGTLTAPTINFEDGGAFSVYASGPGMIIGTEFGPMQGLSAAYKGALCDLYVNFNLDLDLSVPSNIAKFIAGGKPVDPSTFPSAPVLFSGDATGFPNNQGTGGPFSFAVQRSCMGSNGAGPCMLTGAAVGQTVFNVLDLTSNTNVTAGFESTISVNGQIQQTSASDYSADSLTVVMQGGSLTTVPGP